jgi:hypothetical protein
MASQVQPLPQPNDLEHPTGEETRQQALFRIFDKDADGFVSIKDMLGTLASVYRMPSTRQDYLRAVEILGTGDVDHFQLLLDDGKLVDETTQKLCLELDTEQQNPTLTNDDKRQRITRGQIFLRILALNIFLPVTFWARHRFYAVAGVRFFTVDKVMSYDGLMKLMLILHILVWLSIVATVARQPIEGGPAVGLGAASLVAFGLLSAICEMKMCDGRGRTRAEELRVEARSQQFHTINVIDARGVRQTLTGTSFLLSMADNKSKMRSVLSGHPEQYGDESAASKGRFEQRRFTVGVDETATQIQRRRSSWLDEAVVRNLTMEEEKSNYMELLSGLIEVAFAGAVAAVPALLAALDGRPAFGQSDAITVACGICGHFVPVFFVVFVLISLTCRGAMLVISGATSNAKRVNLVFTTGFDVVEAGGRKRSVRISLKNAESIIACTSFHDFYFHLTSSLVVGYSDPLIHCALLFFAVSLLVSVLGLFSVANMSANSPITVSCILLTLIIGSYLLRIIAAAINCTEESNERKLEILRLINSELELESIRCKNNARQLEAAKLLKVFILRTEVMDLHISVFGVKMNMAVAQRLAAAAFGGMATVTFKVLRILNSD